MKSSPFITDFGIALDEAYINRYEIEEEILYNFNSDGMASCSAYMLTGIRGMGKTALMTHISERLNDRWIVININSLRYPLKSLAAALAIDPVLGARFREKKYDFSLLGIGVSIQGGISVSDEELMVKLMLETIRDLGKKLLVTIDEVNNTEEMRQFAASFQIFRRERLPICVIMTGLYHRVTKLQEEKSITFLLRAKRIVLDTLDINMVARRYEELLQVNEDTSIMLAKCSKGYPVAYSNLGNIYWNNGKNKTIDEIKAHLIVELQDRVYNMIWKNLNAVEKQFLAAMDKVGTERIKINNIVEIIKKSSSQVNEIKNALIEEGVINNPEHGIVEFSLPYFGEAVRRFCKLI